MSPAVDRQDHADHDWPILTECLYCGRYSAVLMNHGPGRCIPELNLEGTATG